jgi:hypothetical protein
MLLLMAGIQKESTKEWLVVQTSFHGSASDDFRVAWGEWYKHMGYT